jgi:AcrR family transcriptional regulator
VSTGESTKTRILAAALQLFNEEGYAGLSAVDVANALGISPGHLYYHFKGKPDLAASLMEAHHEELDAICATALRELAAPGAGLEELWTHVHILVEEIHDTRFAWREGMVLHHADARLRGLVERGARLVEGFAHRALRQLRDAGLLALGEEALDGTASQLALGLCLQSTWQQLALGGSASARVVVARAAAMIMLPLTALPDTRSGAD